MTDTTTTTPPAIGDTVSLVSPLFGDDQRREGTVVKFGPTGLMTAEFPQPGHDPMRVTSEPENFTLVRRAPGTLGFIVLVFDKGRWCDDWDGEVHPTLAAGNDALCAARNAGYPAVLTRAVPVGVVPDVSAEIGAAE
jgi:hypothetical protein